MLRGMEEPSLRPPSSPQLTSVCSHCALPLAASAPEPAFCCHGCATAFSILAQAGLSGHASLRRAAADRGLVPQPVDGAAAAQAAEAAEEAGTLGERLAIPLADGRCALAWNVEGMHCPACVWVLERLPALLPGVDAARVEVGRGRLLVVYRPTLAGPAAQARLVATLGYRLRPAGGIQRDDEARRRFRTAALRFALAFAGAVGAMQLAMNLQAGELTGDLDAAGRWWFGGLAIVLALPAATWAAGPWWRALGHALTKGRWSADAAAALVVGVGLSASVGLLIQGSNATYADAVAMFAALLLGGRLALLMARERIAARLERLGGLLPETALRLASANDRTGTLVATANLRPGDLIGLRPGQRLPVDGVAVELDAGLAIDAALLTGETQPQPVAVGTTLFAGTSVVRAHGPLPATPWLTLRVDTVGGETRVARLLAGAEAAAALKVREHPGAPSGAAWERWYGPLLLATAGLTVPVTWLCGVPAGDALARGVAVMMAACPCAIGLALPLARAAALARMAASGVLVAHEGAFARLGAVRRLVIDKTGTLTDGAPGIQHWRWVETDLAARQRIAAAVVAVERLAKHPAAPAIAAAAQREAGNCAAPSIHTWAEIPGVGLRAEVSTGDERADTLSIGPAADLPSNLGVTWNGVTVAHLQRVEHLRPDAPLLMQTARARGWSVTIASGDQPAAVQALGQRLGINDAHGALTPEGKRALVDATTLMIGDGGNDAPALGAAGVSIAVRGGLAAGLACADAVVADDRAPLAACVRWLHAAAALARRERRLLVFTILYNIVVVVLAALGVFGPFLCAIGMPLSSALAVWLAVAGADAAPPLAPSTKPDQANPGDHP
jgi:Cu2+-exporting ATPase